MKTDLRGKNSKFFMAFSDVEKCILSWQKMFITCLDPKRDLKGKINRKPIKYLVDRLLSSAIKLTHRHTQET